LLLYQLLKFCAKMTSPEMFGFRVIIFAPSGTAQTSVYVAVGHDDPMVKVRLARSNILSGVDGKTTGQCFSCLEKPAVDVWVYLLSELCFNLLPIERLGDSALTARIEAMIPITRLRDSSTGAV
jgi:hypothetical protein